MTPIMWLATSPNRAARDHVDGVSDELDRVSMPLVCVPRRLLGPAAHLIGRTTLPQLILTRHISDDRSSAAVVVRFGLTLGIPTNDCPRREEARRCGECQFIHGDIDQRRGKFCGREPDDNAYHSGHTHRAADDQQQLAKS